MDLILLVEIKVSSAPEYLSTKQPTYKFSIKEKFDKNPADALTSFVVNEPFVGNAESSLCRPTPKYKSHSGINVNVVPAPKNISLFNTMLSPPFPYLLTLGN